jgi:hypothetical protein
MAIPKGLSFRTTKQSSVSLAASVVGGLNL